MEKGAEVPMMKISSPGTLYVLGELDHHGEATDLFKIGIVRERENRSARDRLAEHQTGNPRELFLAFSAPAPMVERVETLLHAELSSCRVGGEWFYLPGEELDRAIRRAGNRVLESEAIVGAVVQAVELAKAESDGSVAHPTEEARLLHAALLATGQNIAACKAATKKLTQQLVAEQHARQLPNRWVREDRRAGACRLDAKALEAAYPEIFKRYLAPKPGLSGRFKVNGASPTSVVGQSIPARLACILGEATERMEARAEPSRLHSSLLRIVAEQAGHEWSYERLEVKLRVMCGTHDGLDGVCSWRRRIECRTNFDTDSFRSERPDLYDAFLRKSGDSVALAPVRDLSYRLDYPEDCV